jgi:hypothetical protein
VLRNPAPPAFSLRWASVVAAMVAAQPKEIAMTNAKSRRKGAPRANDSKTTTANGVKRTTALKAGQLKSSTMAIDCRFMCAIDVCGDTQSMMRTGPSATR